MKKNVFTVGIALSLIASSLAGCQSSSASTTADGKVKLTALFIAHPLTKSVNDMQWVKELEEACGVQIEWEQIYTDWDTVKIGRAHV